MRLQIVTKRMMPLWAWIVLTAVQVAGAAQPAPTDPRLAAFVGSWSTRGRVPAAPLVPQWQAKYDANKQRELDYGDLDSNFRRCIPNGVPAAYTNSLDIWVRSKGLVIRAGRNDLRRILLDKLEHTPESQLKPSYEGESIAHWEGNVLVVDTIGLMRSNELATGVGNVKLHVVERFSLAGKQLKVETRVEDSYALERPWVYTQLFDSARPAALSELYCVQSMDRTFDAQSGAQIFRLDDEQVQEKPE